MSCAQLETLIEKKGFDHICDECTYYKTWTESHPYGSTTATETLEDCDCANDSDCPRLVEDD